MANERPNLIVVIIQITNERGFFSCLIRVEFINRSKNGGPRELSALRYVLYLSRSLAANLSCANVFVFSRPFSSR